MMRSDEDRLVRPGLRAERSEDASMARSRGAAHKGEEEAEREEEAEEHETKGETGMAGKRVKAEHVFGGAESAHADGAEEKTDDASAKANRREAQEPERERDEKAAIKSRSVEHTGTFGGGEGGAARGEHTMGHGEREPKAEHTI